MKLTAYKDLDSSKRAQTLSRIILIAGAHLVIIGGAFVVTKFGDNKTVNPDAPSMAGVWSSSATDADQSTVDAGSDSLFDSRAGDLNGYNAGEGTREIALASTGSATNANPSPTARYAPRRPSNSGGNTAPASNSGFSGSATAPAGDGVLQPVRSQSDSLFPDRSTRTPSAPLSQTIEYKVQNADSLWGISKRFNVTVDEIIAVNPGIKANAIRVGRTLNIPRSNSSALLVRSTPAASANESSRAPANGSIYKVKPGDNLSQIASRQGLTVSELKSANGLSGDMIRVGQELVIPASRRTSSVLVAQQHRGPKVTVKAGDTLDKIAAVHGVSIADLIRLNKISDPRLIRIGQTILIPEKEGSVRTSRPERRDPVVSEPVRTAPTRAPTRTLQTLDQLQPRESPPEPLPTLDDAFGEEDLDDQPLIRIKEQ